MSDRQNEQDRQDVPCGDPQAAREHSQRRREYLKHGNELHLTPTDLAKLFRQEEDEDGRAEADSEADLWRRFWNGRTSRPVSPEMYDDLSSSEYFTETAAAILPSPKGMNILLALACWDEQVDSRAPRHSELKYIYRAGFNAALEALCFAINAETINDLGPYFTSNAYLRGLEKETIAAQFVINTALAELGVDVHPAADYAPPIEPSRRGRRRTPDR